MTDSKNKKEETCQTCIEGKRKRLSAKMKVTLLYTFFLMLITISSLVILLSISNSQILASEKSQLEQEVIEGFQYIEYDEDGLDIDSDIMEVDGGIYLSVYNQDGLMLYGKIPYQMTADVLIKDGEFQQINSNGLKWYIFDSGMDIEGYGRVYIRGIISITRAEESFQVLIHTSLIFLPLIVLVMAVVGYRFTSYMLKPVDNMIGAVQEICEREDLSKRVEVTHGNDEIHRLARMFNEMLEQLERNFQRERQFSSDVSHELRTPITVMLSQCEYLLEQPTLTEEDREQVEIIYKKARNMAQIVSQILMVAKAERNQLPLHFEEVFMSELVEMVVEEQREFAKEKGIEIREEIQQDVIAEVDETFFIRLLVNLISNAIAYGRENGTIIVRLSEQDGWIQGEVEDNGIGIPEDKLPFIWERFYRVDQSRTAGQESSSGLGLPIVKSIVKAHGGEITVTSELNQGSLFVFMIPKFQKK